MADEERLPSLADSDPAAKMTEEGADNKTSADNKTEDDVECSDASFKIPVAFTVPQTAKSSGGQNTSNENESSVVSVDRENRDGAQSKDLIKPVSEKKNTSENKLVTGSGFSPAEQIKNSEVTFPYKEPLWSGLCEGGYQFEVIKNGLIIDSIDLSEKPFYVFGRLPSCDITMEHPSLSRHHAVVQYSDSESGERQKGWYIYDLDSTHGTWINKVKMKPKVYNRVRVGHVVKFGGSSRLHILQGPEEDQDEESELSISELKQQREQQKREAELLHQAELLEEETRLQKEKQRLEDKGCMWGIDEDAEEENEDDKPFMPASLLPQNEHLYVDDPKKALKGYFEREGYDLPEYQFVDSGPGKHKCMVELPVDTPSGEPVVAEVVVSGKKKDAVVACALEACRLLDKYGELRKSKHESHKRKAKNWEDDDFYDSDEDTFLDRTGTIEKKRVQRMKRAGKVAEKAETYDSLLEKHKRVESEITEIEAKLEKAKADAAAFENEDVDALDAYMSAIKSGVMDTKTKMKFKRQLIELKQEEQKLRRLVNLAKPAALPEIKKFVAPPSKPLVKAALPSVGKIHKGPKKPLPVPTEKSKPAASGDEEADEEEEEEEDVGNESSELKNTGSERLQPVIESESQTSTSVKQTSVEHLPKTDPQKNVSHVPKVKGPSMSLSEVIQYKLGGDQADKKVTESKKNSSGPKKRPSPNSSSIQKKKTKIEETVEYDDQNPDYATWMPPQGQTGDGKTHLNAKFGY